MPFGANLRWILRHPGAVPRLLAGAGFRDLVLREDLRRIGIRLSAAAAAGLGEARLAVRVVIRLREKLGGSRWRTFLDVGAAHGGYSVAALLAFPGVRVYSFEPLPDVFEALKGSAASRPAITPLPIALGEADGTVSMHRSRSTGSSSLLRMLDAHREHFPGTEVIGETEVRVRPLDALLDDGTVCIERPALMKIDVQGFEDRVLEGATRALDRIDALIVEMSVAPLYEGQVLLPELRRRIQDRGFAWGGVFTEGRSDTTGEIVQVDGLFTRG
ncbi:MAG: FkbM family methyltransferase [Planctomycetota bacterium]|jgi:FkbM family methyltransferase